MDSKYAYVQFLQGIEIVDKAKDGRMVRLNYPINAGELNIVSVDVYKRFVEDFPQRVRGRVIKQENLVNVLNYLYEQLKEDIASLPELDDYTKSRLENLKSEFERNSILTPDHQTTSSINDLVNKYFILQEQVRRAQRTTLEKSNHQNTM